jgi:elongator complex protein 1
MYELPVSSAAVDVAFSPANTFMAILHQTGVDLYEWTTKQQKSLSPRLLGTTKFAKEHLGQRLLPLQISVTETFSVHCLCSGEGPLILAQSFDQSTGEFAPASTMYAGSMFGFSRLTQAISEDVVTQDALGRLHGVASQTDELYSVRHDSQLPWSEVIDLAGDIIAIGLSRNGHLYANTRLLLKNCTSFLVTPAHLIVTTTNHLLKFIHLTHVDGKHWNIHPPQLLLIMVSYGDPSRRP